MKAAVLKYLDKARTAAAARRVRRLAPVAATLMAAVIVAAVVFHHGRHQAYRFALSDGTRIYCRSGSRVTPSPGYPHPREIRLDGDFYIEASAGADPLVLRSRLLVVTVTGAAKLRLSAFSRQPGEEVDVLSGHAQALKAYASPYPEPDTLEAGEMSMVNKDIDLMEKEHSDRAELQSWIDSLLAAAR